MPKLCYEVHKALKEAFQSLYGHTSDEPGIRHAMLKKSSPRFADAKFMLLACSAFVNYLIMTSEDNSIKLAKKGRISR